MPPSIWKPLPGDTQATAVPKSTPKKPRPKNDPNALIVGIIDNDAAIRDSLAFLIESENIPVATFASAREFLDGWNPERTGCILVDIRMPGMSGMELQADLNRRQIRVPLIMITGFGEVQLAVQAMKKGAFDFFEKPIPHQLLLDRLQEALRSETLARKESRQRDEFLGRVATLTATQLNVLKFVVKGKTSSQIAEDLDCSTKTIESHRTSIYKKLGCNNMAAAISMVIKYRVLEGPA